MNEGRSHERRGIGEVRFDCDGAPTDGASSHRPGAGRTGVCGHAEVVEDVTGHGDVRDAG